MDTAGRIDRFRKKYANTPAPAEKPKKEATAKKVASPKTDKPKKPKAEKKEGVADKKEPAAKA